MAQKGKNANGTVTTTYAKHLPHNNIENMDTLKHCTIYHSTTNNTQQKQKNANDE
jgi:hypothetical protein